MTLMHQAAFAAHIGVQKSYVTQLKKAGRLVMEGGKVNVEASIQRIDDTKDPGHAVVAARHQQARELKNAPPVAPPAVMPEGEADRQGLDVLIPEFTGSGYQHHKAMKEKYNALTAKITYEEQIGQLLKTDEARAAVADGDTVIRNRLESLPDILAPQLAAEADEQKIRALLIDYIESLLVDLSRSFYQLAK